MTFNPLRYREFDLVLAELMLTALLCLSMLPIAFLQTRVLFNSVYAGALDTMAARRHLENYVYSQLNLAGLWRLCLTIGRQTVELLGWVLGLFGVRQVVTGLLRRTWCWHSFEAPVRHKGLEPQGWQTPDRFATHTFEPRLAQVDTTYTVLHDTSSGGFVPTTSFAHRPDRATKPAVLTDNFLAKLDGPVCHRGLEP